MNINPTNLLKLRAAVPRVVFYGNKKYRCPPVQPTSAMDLTARIEFSDYKITGTGKLSIPVDKIEGNTGRKRYGLLSNEQSTFTRSGIPVARNINSKYDSGILVFDPWVIKFVDTYLEYVIPTTIAPNRYNNHHHLITPVFAVVNMALRLCNLEPAEDTSYGDLVMKAAKDGLLNGAARRGNYASRFIEIEGIANYYGVPPKDIFRRIVYGESKPIQTRTN